MSGVEFYEFSLCLSDVFLTDGNRVSVATVASTAIAAAQWAVTQVPTTLDNQD